MKAALAAALAAISIAVSAQTPNPITAQHTHIVAVNGSANSQNQTWMDGESGWLAERWTFVPQWLSGVTRLFWDGRPAASVSEFWHTDPWRCDFIVMKFPGGVDVPGIGVYAEAWRPPAFALWPAGLPATGTKWAAYRVLVNWPAVSVSLVAFGAGTEPQHPSFFEQFVP